MSSASPKKRGDLDDLTFYVQQAGRKPWDAEWDRQLIRQRGGIVIDDPENATIVIVDTPAARPDRTAKARVYRYAEALAPDAAVDEWTADLLVRRYAGAVSGTIVLLSKWLEKDASFGPLYGGYLVRGVHVPDEDEDEDEPEPEPPMANILSDRESDYEPAQEASPPKGKQRANSTATPRRRAKRVDSDGEYSPAVAERRTNPQRKAVQSPVRRSRRARDDSDSDIEFVGASQPGTSQPSASQPRARWRRVPDVDEDEDEEPVKRSAGRARKLLFTPTKRAAAPRASGAGRIFAAGRYPLTFYVAPSDNDLLERLIPSEGGGELVAASEANIIILPLARGEEPTERKHKQLVEDARGGVARVVSEDWAWDCLRARPPKLLELDDYEVHLDQAGSSQRKTAPASPQKSTPTSSQRTTKRAAVASNSTPAKRRRGSSAAFEEDNRWSSGKRRVHEIAYYDDEEIDFDGILEEHVERVELLIHYLRRWDKLGDKDQFIRSLGKTNAVRGATDIYYNKGYQHLIDRQVPGLLRAARRASGRVASATSTPSKARAARATARRRDDDEEREIDVELVRDDHKDKVIELIQALRAWDKKGSKSQKLKDLSKTISGAMTLYYAHRNLVESHVPGL